MSNRQPFNFELRRGRSRAKSVSVLKMYAEALSKARTKYQLKSERLGRNRLTY